MKLHNDESASDLLLCVDLMLWACHCEERSAEESSCRPVQLTAGSEDNEPQLTPLSPAKRQTRFL